MVFNINPYVGIRDDLTFNSSQDDVQVLFGSYLSLSKTGKFIVDYYDDLQLIVTFNLTDKKAIEYIVLKPSILQFEGTDLLSLTFKEAENLMKKMDANSRFYSDRSFYSEKFGFHIYSEDSKNWRLKPITSVGVFSQGDKHRF